VLDFVAVHPAVLYVLAAAVGPPCGPAPSRGSRARRIAPGRPGIVSRNFSTCSWAGLLGVGPGCGPRRLTEWRWRATPPSRVKALSQPAADRSAARFARPISTSVA